MRRETLFNWNPDNDEWNPIRAEHTINRKIKTAITLAKQLPISIVYHKTDPIAKSDKLVRQLEKILHLFENVKLEDYDCIF